VMMAMQPPPYGGMSVQARAVRGRSRQRNPGSSGAPRSGGGARGRQAGGRGYYIDHAVHGAAPQAGDQALAPAPVAGGPGQVIARFSTHKLGLQFAEGTAPLVVSGIVQGSAAALEHQQLCPGLQLVSVQGQAVASLTHEQVVALLHGAGRPLVLVRRALRPFLAAVLTGISLCNICSFHEILRAQRPRLGLRPAAAGASEPLVDQQPQHAGRGQTALPPPPLIAGLAV
jgi:hypothetical protein